MSKRVMEVVREVRQVFRWDSRSPSVECVFSSQPLPLQEITRFFAQRLSQPKVQQTYAFSNILSYVSTTFMVCVLGGAA